MRYQTGSPLIMKDWEKRNDVINVRPIKYLAVEWEIYKT